MYEIENNDISSLYSRSNLPCIDNHDWHFGNDIVTTFFPIRFYIILIRNSNYFIINEM